ncbi:MAG: zinc ribbon domain-containing protein [Deltaproteobacteria bacterium]|nr:zinc ribbon domain-containing protein [Deltaproteobacteria bacterium]
MFLLFIISLSIIFYYICTEIDKPIPPEVPLSGECPGCSEKVESGWLMCPDCQIVLRETCPGCGKVHDSWMKFCPWCRHLNEMMSK